MAVLDTYYALRFLFLLTTPFEETDAFKLGIINQEGQRVLPYDKFSLEQERAYSKFTRLVFNLKRLLYKVPFAKSTLARYSAALWLIKEHTGLDNIGELFLEHTGYEERESLLESITTGGFDMKDSHFGGDAVFDCDDDVYRKCIKGKKKYLKYKDYVGDDETGQKIRDYGLKNRKKSIVLRNKQSDAMIYLRKM